MVLSPNPLNANYVAVDFDPFAEGELVNTAAATESQREIWASVQMGDEANCAYNESQTLTLRGQLNVDALQAALQALVDRHEALRTTLSPDGTTLCTQVQQALTVPLRDWSTLSPTEQQTKVDHCLHAAVSTPFDLEHGPLFRAEILCLEPALHQVILTAHHIVCDGWSWGVMVPELGQLYSALSQGQTADLPEPEPFSQYALQLEAAAQSAETAAIEQYWLDQFANSVPVVDFPTDAPRPPLRTFDSTREDWQLDGELVSQLKQLGKANGCSFMTTLLAGFEVFLYRLTGQADLTVGISAAGQAAQGLYHLVGHCVNLLPIRSQIDPQQPVQTYLQRRRSALLDAYDHQQFTFGSLVRRLALPRDASRIPLVSVTFNLDQALDPQQLRFEGLDASLASNPRTFENFEFFINATEAQGKVTLECQYNSNLFQRDTIQRRLAELETLLRGMVQNPQREIAQLPLLPESEQTLLNQWHQQGDPKAIDLPIHQKFEQWASQTPTALAMVGEGQTWTYGEVNARSNQLAHHLQSLGIGIGSLVGICIPRSPQMVMGILGILKAGAAYVPIDPDYPPERQQYMLTDAGVDLLLVPAHGQDNIFSSSLRRLELDPDWTELSSYPPHNLETTMTASSLAYVMYTSGSTGKPKAANITHRGLANYLAYASQRYYTQTLGGIVSSSLAFDGTLTTLLGPLYAGKTTSLLPAGQHEIDTLIQALRTETQPWVFKITPAHAETILGLVGQREISQIPHLVVMGGEQLRTDLALIWKQTLLPQASFFNQYGPTETVIACSSYAIASLEEIPQNHPVVPIGRPIQNVQLYVLDAVQACCPIGVPGELFIGGPGVAAGYHQRPELSAERFVNHPLAGSSEKLYRTGDRVRWLMDGNLEFLGRCDHQINLRGFRIEPGEVEAAINQYPGVQQSVVIAREDSLGDQRLVAYVVTDDNAGLPLSDLRAFLKASLPEYMMPSAVVTLEALPLTPNGKVDRKQLPRPEKDANAQTRFAVPETETEQQVAAIWCDVLGVNAVGRHDNFFDLGGHSLLAVQIVVQLQQVFAINLRMPALFEHPTVATLASHIETICWAAATPATAMTADDDADFEEGEL
ncbi:non-ribosomal peptide synthetase [Leptolyngbya sp. PCC 6406]|uniref:non-ribosomal peptide synthetase n=1 Tax=Leptolyngbya sp. PCC 6406 TaxID=1173264 RepID=UPI0002AD0FFC|nr:non-ribosomal peptide synthetase [Leptolyngbya sp. PCC 6406]